MTRKTLCRIAAGLLLFFAVAHTFGMLSHQQPTPEAAAVRQSMDAVQFPIMGMTRSYGDFYFGFGMLLTTFLVFSAGLAWWLGGASGAATTATRPLVGGLAACIAVVAAISWRWFFLPPAVTTTLATLVLLLAATR